MAESQILYFDEMESVPSFNERVIQMWPTRSQLLESLEVIELLILLD